MAKRTVEMDDRCTVALLHGAGTGPWIWDRMIAGLSRPAAAMTYPGRAHDATPDSCADAVAAALDHGRTGSVILVLHSLAGVLAPGLSRALGDRLEHCVYVSAVIPPADGAFVDALGFVQRTVLRTLFRFNRNGLKPSAAMIRRELCNDLSEADAEAVLSRYAAEMPGLYLTPVEAAPAVDCTYVKLLRDQSVPLKQQESMIARLEKPAVREIDAGHLVMLSKPDELVEVINSITI